MRLELSWGQLVLLPGPGRVLASFCPGLKGCVAPLMVVPWPPLSPLSRALHSAKPKDPEEEGRGSSCPFWDFFPCCVCDR